MVKKRKELEKQLRNTWENYEIAIAVIKGLDEQLARARADAAFYKAAWDKAEQSSPALSQR